jgi:hypothetical protein
MKPGTLVFLVLPFLFGGSSLLLSCKGPQTTSPSEDLLKVTINQGIAGRVWFWEGNFMPITTNKPYPVSRIILVHGPTHLDSVESVGYSPFYSRILTAKVAQTTANDSGFFEVSLPPGRYSLFIREDSLFYSNSFDGQGYIQLVTVKSDSVTMHDINITYKASF